MGNLLTIEEVAERLRVEIHTVRSWRRRKVGPPLFLVEGNLRCDEDELNAYVRAQREATLTGDPRHTIREATKAAG